MTPIALLIVAAIFLSGVLEIYLERRQILAVAAHKDQVPPAFARQLSLEDHRRAADYTLARTRLSVVEKSFDTIVTILWLAVFLAPAYALISHLIAPGLTRSVAIVVFIGAVGYLLDLPLTLYRTFRLEAAYGFNRTTPPVFVLDQLKAIALQLCLAVPLLYAFFAIERAIPGYWWLIGWAGFMALMVAMIVIYPMFIAPLFNKFTPMPDSPLREKIEALLARCGFESKGLFVMDASKRSTHGNAYFSGLGKAKRIVFFDTLLQEHSEDEILSILAHELGHFKYGHIKERVIEAAAMAFVGFAVMGWAFASGGLAKAFGLADDPGLVLVIVMFAIGPFAHLLSPLTNFLSRRAEFQADGFAKSIFGAEPMVSALTKLSRDNLATLTPDGLYALFYYSHPPISERIAHLEAA
ncbi:MAG: M48 family metallopeptidase [Methylovirgula sp.]|jgi:STE24 endopeptidase